MGVLLLLSSGCARKHRTAHLPPAPHQRSNTGNRAEAPPPSPPHAAPPAVPVGYTEEGKASWYGVPYHGRPAADGEIYDMETMVAAHRVLPFNTWLEVTNLQNGKSVKVRVIDRGPFVGGRIIDLSHAAAREIDLIGPGVAPVRLQVISAPPAVTANNLFAVQAGAFASYENAERARAQYAQRFGSAQLVMKQGPRPLYRVLVGKERSMEAAQKLADQLRLEVLQVFIVRLDETVPEAPVVSTASTPNP
jgi:peptidoglycan lytic transglycosylase